MFALNFQWPNHEELLINRKKNCTVRLGDIRDTYPENSMVWITFGKKFASKKKLYLAIIDKVYIKRFADLTTHDLGHQNPEIKSVSELLSYFEKIDGKTVDPDDIVTVIYFSEILS
ncbi:MAG: RNA-binding protein [Negativicutes bacterium]|nr:RNA-binding protein [Negativicutes bacterium]